MSSPGQATRDLSIPEQIRQVREFCKVRGWTVVEIYKDAGISGAESVNRPEFQRMLKAAYSKARPFDAILTRDQARFGRGNTDQALREKLREHGVAVGNIANPSDLDAPMTPTGEMLETVIGAMDILSRKTSTLQMIAGQKAKARKGGIAGAQATGYGFKQKWVSIGDAKPVRQPVIDKAKAKVVREIFRRYLAGESLTGITRWLNATSIAAPGGGSTWYQSTVRKLVSNEVYFGRLVYGAIKKTKHAVTRTPVNTKNTGEVIRVDDVFPPIVDKKTFDRAQVILSRNEATRPKGGHPGNTLRSLGKCAVCGWHLAHQRNSGTGKWYYFCGKVKMHGAGKSDPACKGIVQASYVDKVVTMFLKRILSTSVTDIQAQVKQYNAAATNLVGLSATEALDTAIAEHESTIDNLTTAIGKKGGSTALLSKLESAELKLADLRRERHKIAAAVLSAPVEVGPILEARSEIKAALGKPAKMRALLAAIVSEVRCDWTKRSNPVLNFGYSFKGESRPVRLILLSEDSDPLDVTDVERPGYKGSLSVDIAVPGAPLTFVPKWSVTNAERAARDAIEQISEALRGAD